MCTTCGCDDHHQHDHHQHDHHHGAIVRAEIDVLEKSRRLADDNRRWLVDRGVFMLNLMSAPGAGKTTLLERTIAEIGVPVFVIEGDQATSFDADRIRAAGAEAVQVNTGTGCHLDPHMVRHALEDLAPPRGALVIVENVGNLVCPALFDLGEAARVVILSVPEGDDKPRKYPHMFRAATLVLLSKIDLLPYVAFDVERAKGDLSEVSPRARVASISAQTGEGVAQWCGWLRDAVAS